MLNHSWFLFEVLVDGIFGYHEADVVSVGCCYTVSLLVLGFLSLNNRCSFIVPFTYFC